MARAKKIAAEHVEEGVERILSDERVCWLPIKHFSPACALRVRQCIEALEPVAVLVEGPDDATELIEHIVDPRTQPPLTVFSVYVDKKNVYGMNGVHTPDEQIPARFRGWWPLTEFAPEYQALVTGARLGAELRFIDLPLTARIPFNHAESDTEVVADRHLALGRYFEALSKKQRRRSFEEFWEANFEVGQLEGEAFRRALLTFAWCSRHTFAEEALQADGTLTREAHMRWHINTVLKAHPEGRVVVVTGAFHSVALPFVKPKKAKIRKDRNLQTLLTPHSFPALARLYEMQRLPAYGQAVWEAMLEEEPRPFDQAAMELVVHIMREARGQAQPVSTADAVGAWRAAQNLAQLRGNPQVSLHDLLDAAQMGYVKGDARLAGGSVEKAARRVLVGRLQGRVCEAAGALPLMSDFYAGVKAHRLDISGDTKTVRLDLHKQRKHRLKSAFLHRCDYLEVPCFASLDHRFGGKAHYRGPDPVSGENMHLITEAWGFRWQESVDDRLVELADRGASLGQAAATTLREEIAEARDHAADATRLLLRSAQMMLLELFDELIETVDEAVAADGSFTNLVDALADFVVLHGYRDALATQGMAKLVDAVKAIFTKATMALPKLAHTAEEHLSGVLDRVQTLVRVALTFDAVELDRELLVERLRALVVVPEGRAGVRGAGYGLLYAFGEVRERDVARELEGYLRGAPDKVLEAGAFLDGLFMSAKSIVLRSPRLLRTINGVLAELDWETFKTLLPDLRRAFTQFIPRELDGIALRVGEEIGLTQRPSPDAPIPRAVAETCRAADARIAAVLEGWW